MLVTLNSKLSALKGGDTDNGRSINIRHRDVGTGAEHLPCRRDATGQIQLDALRVTLAEKDVVARNDRGVVTPGATGTGTATGAATKSDEAGLGLSEAAMNAVGAITNTFFGCGVGSSREGC